MQNIETEASKKEKRTRRRKETYPERLARVLVGVKTMDSIPTSDYLKLVSTKKGLTKLISSNRCPLILEDQGSYHIVFRPSTRESRRKHDQQITNINSYTNDSDKRYVSHTTAQNLGGPKSICRFSEISREQAIDYIVRIKTILMSLGRDNEDFMSVVKLSNPKFS